MLLSDITDTDGFLRSFIVVVSNGSESINRAVLFAGGAGQPTSVYPQNVCDAQADRRPESNVVQHTVGFMEVPLTLDPLVV